jgi:hypothetical protein
MERLSGRQAYGTPGRKGGAPPECPSFRNTREEMDALAEAVAEIARLH